jgi:nitroreductase
VWRVGEWGVSVQARRPWDVAGGSFPVDASGADKLRAAVEYAVLAPSGHNTQPWRFKLVDEALELRADRTRALPVVDPHDRELTISCGAALAFVRIALRHLGYDAVTEVLPEPVERDLLARVRLSPSREPHKRDRALFEAIPRRRTMREPFEARDLPAELVDELEQLAEQQGASLAAIEPDARREVATLVGEGDRIQAADPHFRRELAAWFRPNDTARRDGIPGYAFGMGDLFSRVGALVLRRVNWGKYQTRKDLELLARTPLLAVLGTDGDSPRDWLAAGQALGYILLRARAEGASASYLNQPIEVAELRPRLAAATGRPTRFPQLLLRLGYAGDRKPTPRRDAAEVVTVT